ncbi:hypothetical protein RYX36_022001 [Vicia faba]
MNAYFEDYTDISMNLQFNDDVIVIFASHTMVTVLVAYILDLALTREDDAVRDESGLKWWEKFSIYGSNVRSNEFYGFPCRLNELFSTL